MNNLYHSLSPILICSIRILVCDDNELVKLGIALGEKNGWTVGRSCRIKQYNSIQHAMDDIEKREKNNGLGCNCLLSYLRSPQHLSACSRCYNCRCSGTPGLVM